MTFDEMLKLDMIGLVSSIYDTVFLREVEL
jgi:hypothetical protein